MTASKVWLSKEWDELYQNKKKESFEGYNILLSLNAA